MVDHNPMWLVSLYEERLLGTDADTQENAIRMEAETGRNHPQAKEPGILGWDQRLAESHKGASLSELSGGANSANTLMAD